MTLIHHLVHNKNFFEIQIYNFHPFFNASRQVQFQENLMNRFIQKSSKTVILGPKMLNFFQFVTTKIVHKKWTPSLQKMHSMQKISKTQWANPEREALQTIGRADRVKKSKYPNIQIFKYSNIDRLIPEILMIKESSNLTGKFCIWRKRLFYPTTIYLFKASNGNISKMCEICSKLTMKTLSGVFFNSEQNFTHGTGVSIVPFKQMLVG